MYLYSDVFLSLCCSFCLSLFASFALSVFLSFVISLVVSLLLYVFICCMACRPFLRSFVFYVCRYCLLSELRYRGVSLALYYFVSSLVMSLVIYVFRYFFL